MSTLVGRLPEKGRSETEKIVEKMKERTERKRKLNESEEMA